MLTVIVEPEIDSAIAELCLRVRQVVSPRTIYGSFKCNEIAVYKDSSDFYLLSDIDLDFDPNSPSFNQLKRKIERIIPGIKIDASPVDRLKSAAQRNQRLLPPSRAERFNIETSEIDEAIAIRAFYSAMDYVEAKIADDVLGVIYSSIRLVAEVPLYYCWSAGMLVSGYAEQADYAMSHTKMQNFSHAEYILEMSRIKRSCFAFENENLGRSLMDSSVKAFECFRSAGVNLVSDAKTSIFINRVADTLANAQYESRSQVSKDMMKLYEDYCDISADGFVRQKYLHGRLIKMAKELNNVLQLTRILLATNRNVRSCNK